MGKKSPTPPPAPDYAGAAKEQGVANLAAARTTARLTNPNIQTPLGGQRVTFGRSQFDKSGYDKALASYNTQLEAQKKAQAEGKQYAPTEDPSPEFTDYGDINGMGGGMEGLLGGVPASMRNINTGPSNRYKAYDPTTQQLTAPTREQFTSQVDLDTPNIEQYLTENAQKAFDAQQRVELGLSNLGEQGLDIASDVMGKRFNPNLPNLALDYGGYGEIGNAPNLASYGQAGSNVREEQLNYGPRQGQYGQAGGGPDVGQYGYAGSGPNAPSQIEGANYSGLQNVGYGPQEGEYGYASGYVPQQQLNQNINTRGLAQAPINAGMTAQNAIMSRLDPQIKRQRAGVENQLAQQGLVRGGEAYGAAINEQQQQENDLRTQAALQGINLDMAARQQGFGERQTMADFANQAKQNQFGMGVTGAGLRNQAVGQNLGQGLSINQAQNANQGQDFQQRMAAGQFGREGQQLGFSMGQSQQEAANRASGQNFAQAQAAQEARNRAMSQNYGQDLALAQAQNATAAQMFGMNMDRQGLYNTALTQNQNAAMQQYQADINAQNLRYNQAANKAQFGNEAIQQSLAQQLALRNQPLNEITALMSGGQIQMPQFQAYQGADVAAAPLFAGSQAAGDFAQKNYANQTAAYNAQMGLLGGIAGGIGTAAGGAGGLSKIFTSDRRLKSNIVKVGVHPLNIGIYEYDIGGERQRGVMADEVEQVLPDAVVTRKDGYKMVNYGML